MRHERYRFEPWVGKIPWARKWQSTPGHLPRKLHEQRNLAGYSPWGPKELDMTEHAHTWFWAIHDFERKATHRGILDGTWERASRVLGKKPASNRSQASLWYQARWDVWKPVLWLRSTLAYGRAMHGSLQAWPWLVPHTESRSDW